MLLFCECYFVEELSSSKLLLNIVLIKKDYKYSKEVIAHSIWINGYNKKVEFIFNVSFEVLKSRKGLVFVSDKVDLSILAEIIDEYNKAHALSKGSYWKSVREVEMNELKLAR